MPSIPCEENSLSRSFCLHPRCRSVAGSERRSVLRPLGIETGETGVRAPFYKPSATDPRLSDLICATASSISGSQGAHPREGVRQPRHKLSLESWRSGLKLTDKMPVTCRGAELLEKVPPRRFMSRPPPQDSREKELVEGEQRRVVGPGVGGEAGELGWNKPEPHRTGLAVGSNTSCPLGLVTWIADYRRSRKSVTAGI